MPLAKIPFGEFAPDIADLNTGVLQAALNVYPGAKSYEPVPGLVAFSDALSGDVRGLFACKSTTGSTVVFAFTSTKAYKLSGETWTDVTNAGGDYTLADGDYWQGVQFGEYFVAVAPGEAPQEIDIDSGTEFSDVAGTPPSAGAITVCNNVLILSRLDSDPYGIAWCDTNDRTDWSGGNSGSQSFAEGGRVLHVSGSAKLIVQEEALQRIIVTGSTEAELGYFNFDRIVASKGTITPYGVINYGGGIAYLSDEGFYIATAGEQRNIGHQKVNKWFFEQVFRNRIDQIQGAFDPLNTRFFWSYPTEDSDFNTHILVYDWSLPDKQWSVIEVSTYVLTATALAGATLESLDDISASLDALEISLDSPLWQGGQPVFGAIDSSKKLAYFQGDNMEATIRTGHYNLAEGRRVFVSSLSPLLDTSDVTARVCKRQRLADGNDWTGFSAMQASGAIPVRADGKIHCFEYVIGHAANWTHFMGDEVTYMPSGSR